MNGTLDIYIDGACRGNPGEASVGVIIQNGEKKIKEIAKAIGHATNNIAEYTALIYALQEALLLKAEYLKIHTDSELLYQQMIGHYDVKSPNIKTLFEQAQQLARGFKKIEIKHIPREMNKDADRLASTVLKKKQAKVVAPTFRQKSEVGVPTLDL